MDYFISHAQKGEIKHIKLYSPSQYDSYPFTFVLLFILHKSGFGHKIYQLDTKSPSVILIIDVINIFNNNTASKKVTPELRHKDILLLLLKNCSNRKFLLLTDAKMSNSLICNSCSMFINTSSGRHHSDVVQHVLMLLWLAWSWCFSCLLQQNTLSVSSMPAKYVQKEGQVN